MAVDLLVMPLSRYLSGNYILPVMREAWEIGAQYGVMTPKGLRHLGPGTPYGGPEAAARHPEMIAFMKQLIPHLPQGIADHPWDEENLLDEDFHGIENASFGVLIEEARTQFNERISIFSRICGKKPRRGHFASAVHFLPVDFGEPFDLNRKIFASVHRALRELETGAWSSGTEPSLSMVREAFQTAVRLRLPLVIDS